MSMALTLDFALPVVLYDLGEAGRASLLAHQVEGQLYCWKTTGRSNWLARGLSIADVLGVVVLPKGLPECIDMPDDPEP